MNKDDAIALFTKLHSEEYPAEADPEGEEEPFISGFTEPTYEVTLLAELLTSRAPAERSWAVEVRFSDSVWRPEGTGQLRTLLDAADEAGVGLSFPTTDRVRFS